MDPNVTLRPQQIDDLAFAIGRGRSLFLHDPAVGKTAPACAFMWYQWKELNSRSLWTMPNSLRMKNKVELLRFTDFEPHEVAILEHDHLKASESEQRGLANGRSYKRLHGYEQFFDRLAAGETIDLIAECDAKVIITGFRFVARFWKRLAPMINCFVVDEMHMAYGSPHSQNTSALYGIMNRCEGFLGMTGTLLNGKLDSVFPAIHVIEPRYYPLGYSDFRHQHVGFEDDYGRVLTWKNEEKVGQILLNHGRRRTFEQEYGKEDVVFLPDLCFMGPQMEAAYEEFHEAAMLELEDGTFIDGSLPGVAVIRARQIIAHPETMGLCQGEVTGKDERLIIHTTDAIERGEAQLILSVHVAEQERIVKLLQSMGRRVALMNGSTPSSHRSVIDEAFRAGEIDDIVGSPKTMGVGFNWNHVAHVIAVSYEYTDVDWLQAYRRASRGVRTSTLRVSIMQYADSVDSRVLQIIHQKSILANKVDPTRPILSLRLAA